MSPRPNQPTLLRPSTTTTAAAVNTTNHTLPTDDPPDSFWLSQDAELDWLDRNAFLDRNHSTKANQSQHHHHQQQQQHQSSIPSSHKFLQSQNSNASTILWIPKPQRRSSFPESKRGHHHHHHHREMIRLVPKRNDQLRTEPSSPKVSCTGRVRLKSNQSTKKKKERKMKKKKKTEPRAESTPRMKGGSSGLWKKLRQVFRSGKLKKAAARAAEESEIPVPEMRMRSRSVRSSMVEPLTEPVAKSLNRFASGRKSDSWIDDLKDAIDEVEEMECKKLGSVTNGVAELWRRRNIDELGEVDCGGRDWLATGPASV